MTLTKDTHVTVKDGDFRVEMGTALTTFFAKNRVGSDMSQFVLRTDGEIDKLIKMLQTAKEAIKASPPVITEITVPTT